MAVQGAPAWPPSPGLYMSMVIRAKRGSYTCESARLFHSWPAAPAPPVPPPAPGCSRRRQHSSSPSGRRTNIRRSIVVGIVSPGHDDATVDEATVDEATAEATVAVEAFEVAEAAKATPAASEAPEVWVEEAAEQENQEPFDVHEDEFDQLPAQVVKWLGVAARAAFEQQLRACTSQEEEDDVRIDAGVACDEAEVEELLGQIARQEGQAASDTFRQRFLSVSSSAARDAIFADAGEVSELSRQTRQENEKILDEVERQQGPAVRELCRQGFVNVALMAASRARDAMFADAAELANDRRRRASGSASSHG